MLFASPGGVSRSFTRKVIVWFTGATLVLVAGTVAGLIGARSLTQQNSNLTKTLGTRVELGQLVGDLQRLQTLCRDYVIFGTFSTLTPCLETVSRIHEDLKVLDADLGQTREQAVRLRELKPAVERQLVGLNHVLEVYRASGRDAAFEALATMPGAGEMPKIDAQVNAIEVAEQRMLHERQGQVSMTGQWALVIALVSMLLCYGIFIFLFWLIRREGVRRTETEVYLQRAIEEKERANLATNRINKIADFLQSCRTPDEAFLLISQQMPALLPGTSGGIGVNSADHSIIEMVLSWGDDLGCTSHFKAEECWALRRGRMHVTDSMGSDPVCGHVTSQHLISLCMPMMAHGEAVGMLYVTSNEHSEFTDDMVNLVRAVSEQAALALANLQLQETLRAQSIRDPLTHLYNRRYMEASLEREVSRAKRNDQPLSVIMIDIDHFKKFNDTYGHEAGDLLLSEFGQLVSRHVRAEDIGCRYGGEEFALILPGADPGVARCRAEALRIAAKALDLQYNNVPLGSVTISIGYATYPDTNADPTKLVRAADLALYRAKSGGRDRVVAADEQAGPAPVSARQP